MADSSGNMLSRITAVSEAVRHLETQILPLEPHLLVPTSDFDTTSASAVVARAARLLAQLHNSAQRVVRLPTDVLCMVFLALRDEHEMLQRDFMGLEVGPRYCDRWIRIAWVCRLWRSVALDYAPLWSRFCLRASTSLSGESEKLESFLANSRRTVLVIEATDELPSAAQSLILQQASRLHRLLLRGPLEKDQLQLLNARDAPVLEALELYSSPSDSESELPTLFNGVHPHLITLAITGFTRYKPNSLSGIKHLHLGKQHYKTLDDIERVVNLLRDLSELEQLVFLSTCDSGLNITTSQLATFSRRAIDLPRLQRIIFADIGASFLSAILSIISVHPGQIHSIVFPGRLPSTAYCPKLYTTLHGLRGPGWEEICSSAQKFSVSNGPGGYDVVVQSCGRELHIVSWMNALDDLSTAFRPAISHAREIWICAHQNPRHGGTSPDRLLEAFLPHARMADAVYLDFHIPRAGSVLGSLYAKESKDSNDARPRLIPVPENGHRHEMDLHVKMDTTSPKAYGEVRGLRAALHHTNDTYSYIANICVYAPECKESLKLQKWAGRTNDEDRETHSSVQVFTRGETFPHIQPSTTLAVPCPFRWM